MSRLPRVTPSTAGDREDRPDRLEAAFAYAAKVGARKRRQRKPLPASVRERLVLRALERCEVAAHSLIEVSRLLRVAVRTTEGNDAQARALSSALENVLEAGSRNAFACAALVDLADRGERS